jgi:hypothetical protein
MIAEIEKEALKAIAAPGTISNYGMQYREWVGSDTAFFSRISNSERLTFDLWKSSRIWSSCSFIVERNSQIVLISDLMALSDIYTSVIVNLPSFLGRFFMDDIVMKKEFSVKRISREGGRSRDMKNVEFVPKNEVMQGLSFKKGKENSSNGSYLAYPEDKHPADNPGFNLSKPFFKTFLSDFQHSLLSAVFNPVENFDKRISAFVSEFIPQNLRYRDNSHVSSSCLITRTVYHSLENLSSKAYADYEHVYDIEVEGTHNFIVGHWIKKAGRLESSSSPAPCVFRRDYCPQHIYQWQRRHRERPEGRLTGLRLYDFKCAWFDENAYFEFFPLHVAYKLRGRQKKEDPKQMKFDELVDPGVDPVR